MRPLRRRPEPATRSANGPQAPGAIRRRCCSLPRSRARIQPSTPTNLVDTTHTRWLSFTRTSRSSSSSSSSVVADAANAEHGRAAGRCAAAPVHLGKGSAAPTTRTAASCLGYRLGLDRRTPSGCSHVCVLCDVREVV